MVGSLVAEEHMALKEFVVRIRHLDNFYGTTHWMVVVMGVGECRMEELR